jgi:hypothetical protein
MYGATTYVGASASLGVSIQALNKGRQNQSV